MKNNWHGAAGRIGLWATSGAVFPAAAVPVTGPEGGCGTAPEAKQLTHCTLQSGPVPDNCKYAAGIVSAGGWQGAYEDIPYCNVARICFTISS